MICVRCSKRSVVKIPGLRRSAVASPRYCSADDASPAHFAVPADRSTAVSWHAVAFAYLRTTLSGALLQTWGTAARRHPVGGFGCFCEMLIENNHALGRGRGSTPTSFSTLAPSPR